MEALTKLDPSSTMVAMMKRCLVGVGGRIVVWLVGLGGGQ